MAFHDPHHDHGRCTNELIARAEAVCASRKTRLTAQRREDAIVFSVSDQGPGIPGDMKDRIFDWFETHPLGSQHRGAGLGLSIVRSFVELHGGTVTLDSDIGQGTTVTCTFPIEHSAGRTAAASSRARC